MYHDDLVHLGIVKEGFDYIGNCMACYRVGIKGYRCVGCNSEILGLESTEMVYDPYFVGKYYRQFDMDPITIQDHQMKPPPGNAMEIIRAVFMYDGKEGIDATAATRGKNALVPADPPLFYESEPEESEPEEAYGENVPNNGNNRNAMDQDDMDDDSNHPSAQRPTYHNQQKPLFGTDEYILELVTQVESYTEQDEPKEDESSDVERMEFEDDDEPPPEPPHPLDTWEFNEDMYRRLQAMTIGNLCRYHS